jgi:hypothetical protein
VYETCGKVDCSFGCPFDVSLQAILVVHPHISKLAYPAGSRTVVSKS